MELKDKIKRLDKVFNPRAVVVVGDKKITNYMWLRGQSEFKGRLYSVNIDPNEFEGIAALGVPNYKSLMDVPDDEIDYVIVAVPREVSPIIMRDCIKKGVSGAMFFTSGFKETATEKGIQLQETLTQMATEADFLTIGPNCMGIFNPKMGIRSSITQYTGESGPVGFVSQSGTHSINFAVTAYANGVKASKVVSIGNCIILEAADYLEYLMQDEETKVIGMYIESVKDGKKFFRLLRECSRKKPVMIWKGGQTPAGTRATASHTASLAEPMAIWDAMIKQAGAIRIDSLDDAVDTAKALVHCPPVTGYRMGLISTTGGQSVVITDSFAKAGLDVGDFTKDSYARLESFFNIVGGSCKNPIDMGQNWAGEQVPEVLSVLEDDPTVDAIALELSAGRLQRGSTLAERFFPQLEAFHKRSRKPLLVIVYTMQLDAEAAELRSRVLEMGIPAFHTFERAAKALKSVVDYHRFVKEGE